MSYVNCTYVYTNIYFEIVSGKVIVKILGDLQKIGEYLSKFLLRHQLSFISIWILDLIDSPKFQMRFSIFRVKWFVKSWSYDTKQE